MLRACLVALLLVGCGRTSLKVGRDAAAPPPGRDAGPTPGRDAGPSPVPTEGCTMGPILGPYTMDAPAFAFTLDRLGDGWVVGYAHGWPPDTRAALATLDLDLHPGSFRRRLGVSGDQVSAAAADGWVASLASVDAPDRLELTRIRADGDVWASGPTDRLCEGCFAPWVGAPPVFDGLRVTVAYVQDGRMTLWSDPGASARPRRFERDGEDDPRVVAAPTGGVVLVTNPSDRSGTTVRWLSDDLEPLAAVEVPIVPVGSAPGLLARDDDVLVVGRADAEGAMHVVRATADHSVDAAPLDVDEGLYVEAGVAESRGVVAIVLEGTRSNWVLALRADTLAPVMDPVAIVDETRGSGYRRPTTIAPHPEGFAIVYGAWHREGNYGLYGRLLSCRGFD